jgi:regulation of enolase protein 1 (concanavalin A-like superfamily)
MKLSAGDGSITARVVSQTDTYYWAKAGVMIRETLAAGATNALVAITPSNGVVYQARSATGGSSADITFGPIVHTPYWLRVVRAGNVFTGYLSPDGSTWTSLGQTTIAMASQAYVGLAVASLKTAPSAPRYSITSRSVQPQRHRPPVPRHPRCPPD